MEERSPASCDPPTPECLVRRIPQLRRFLGRRTEKFSTWVIEQAIDRVIRYALPYINEDEDMRICKLDNPKDREAWIFRLALKAAKQLASRQADCDSMERDKLDDAIRPVSRYEEADPLIEALHAALDLLTPRQREILDLCVVWGMTHQQVAEKLNRNHKTVACVRKAAVKKIRRLLGDRKTAT